MKLINESNWKQEIARLKAERILCNVQRMKMLSDYCEEPLTPDNYHIVGGMLLYVQSRIAQLDKAIETIENVFVHKQCYIDN